MIFLGKKIFEIPPFFQTRPGDLGKKIHACSLRFSALKRSEREPGNEVGVPVSCNYRQSQAAEYRTLFFCCCYYCRGYIESKIRKCEQNI